MTTATTHPVIKEAAKKIAKRQAIDWDECDEDERDEFRFDAKAAFQASEPLLASAYRTGLCDPLPTETAEQYARRILSEITGQDDGNG